MDSKLLNGTDPAHLRTTFASSLENLGDTYAFLKTISDSDSLEILFYNEEQALLYEKVKGTKLETKFLDESSILGRAFWRKKAQLIQNVSNASVYNVAIDNPFKIEMSAQLVIPTVFEGKVEGLLRFSKLNGHYDDTHLERIRYVAGSFREIFLNDRYLKDMEMQRHPFSLDTVEVYKTLKEIKATYARLLEHTENPEIKKLLLEGQTNADTVFRYLNPNLDNISRVKNELRQLNRNKTGQKGLKVLVADDVHMNVKILNSLLNNEESVGEILTAYDGNQASEAVRHAFEDDAPIDVIFLDHHMPGKLGLEVAEEIKSGAFGQMFIVSITNDPGAIQEKLHLFDFQMSKPFVKASVEAIMQEITEKGKCEVA